jgi:hypothetical protein
VSWISEHKNVRRVAVLVLLLVAVIGPWSYSADGAPPAERCHAPFILLENGRCVGLVSGATILTFVAAAFLDMSVGLVTGETVLADGGGEFLITLRILLLVLPFFSTLFRILGGDRRRLRVFHVIAWGLAAVSALPLAVSGLSELPSALWGIWLYIGLAAVTLTLELLALVAERRPDQGQRQGSFAG